MAKNVLDLYEKHFIDKSDERLGLFVLMANHFAIGSALYPGSFTHLTPSFVFPITSFVDLDQRAARFFEDPRVLDLVNRRKIYDKEPLVRFHHRDYSQSLNEDEGIFDLLISQYAGYVSQECRRYLRISGFLLANNSHGDASMASIDPNYQLIAAINRRGERYGLTEKHLGGYFIPRSDIEVTREYLGRIKRGVGYKKSAFSYVFQRVASHEVTTERLHHLTRSEG